VCVCVCVCMCESSAKHTLISYRLLSLQGKQGELSQILLMSISMGRSEIMESVSSLFIPSSFMSEFLIYTFFVYDLFIV
jgi:hypothetical protein